jgi:serine/threonine-protein kinase RsbW
MPSYHLTVASDMAEIPRLIDWVEECCGAAGVNSEAQFKLALSLDEAVTNVISHAFVGMPPPHHIAIELAVGADRVEAEVIDNGPAFDPTAAPEPDRDMPLIEQAPGGWGIPLIRKMMDEVVYRRVDGQNRLRMVKSLH